MGFCGIGQLAAYVDIRLGTDAIGALADMQKVQVRGVEVHEITLAFGDVDVIAAIKTDLSIEDGRHPTWRLAEWVNEVAKKSYVRSTSTRILVHDQWHDQRMREQRGRE